MAAVEDLVASVRPVLQDSKLTLIVEPGRSIIGDTAVLATTVIGIKENRLKRFIITDGAMTEVVRPSLYGAYHHIELTEPTKLYTSDPTNFPAAILSSEGQSFGKRKYVYDIVGPVCESTDFLGKNRELPTPHAGCGLAVFDVGAYCSSMSSNYNLRLRPSEILVDGDNWSLIRKPDRFDDLMKPYSTGAPHWQWQQI